MMVLVTDMPAGRPTDYTPELIDKAYEYIEVYKEKGEVFPSVAGLARHINRARATMYAWAKEPDKGQFSDILDCVMELQEIVLTNKGLSGDFNSVMTKLMLTKHGYSDKQETAMDLKVGYESMTDEELDAEVAKRNNEQG